MIEPTETESIEEIDRFIIAMKSIRKEIRENPELLRNAPHSTKLLYSDDGISIFKARSVFPRRIYKITQI